MAKLGYYGPMTNRGKVQKHFWNPIITTKNFAFEVKAKLDLESTHLESRVAKIGLNDPQDYWS